MNGFPNIHEIEICSAQLNRKNNFSCKNTKYGIYKNSSVLSLFLCKKLLTGSIHIFTLTGVFSASDSEGS
jgi:hypothetical protein